MSRAVDVEGDVCVTPNSFALASTVEYFRIPSDVLTICLGKSTTRAVASSSAPWNLSGKVT